MVNSIMGNNGRGIVLCGNSLEDMERGMEALRSALNSGATMGIGASSLAELEEAMNGLRQFVAHNQNVMDASCGMPSWVIRESVDDEDEDDEDEDEDDEDEDELDEDEDEEESSPISEELRRALIDFLSNFSN